MASYKTVFAYLVASVVLLLLVCALHIWRYVRTRAGYHILLTVAALLSALPLMAGLIAHGRKSRIERYIVVISFASVLSHLLLVLSPTAVLTGWGRSMRATLGRLGRATFIIGLVWMVLFVLAALLHFAHLGIDLGYALDMDKDEIGSRSRTMALMSASRVIQVLGLALLCVFSLALGVMMTLKYRMQVAQPQRTQLFVLAAAFLLLFSAMMLFYYGVLIGYMIAIFLVYLVLLYPCNVVAGK